MVLIRPLIRANDERRHNVHVIIFFIFIVSNVAGSLTPLGDPPLFLGFLQGVSFFWTTTHILPEFLTAVGILLVVFFGLDSALYRADAHFRRLADPTPSQRFTDIGLKGKINLIFLVIIVVAVLMSGLWKSGVELHLLGVEVSLQDLTRDIVLIVVAIRLLRPDAEGGARGAGILVRPDPGGGQAVRRHLRHHDAGPDPAARRCRGTVLRARGAHQPRPTAARTTCCISG